MQRVKPLGPHPSPPVARLLCEALGTVLSSRRPAIGPCWKRKLGNLSKRISDHEKHIGGKAPHKASDALSRVKAEQRAEATKTKRQARVDFGLIHSEAISTGVDADSSQSGVSPAVRA